MPVCTTHCLTLQKRTESKCYVVIFFEDLQSPTYTQTLNAAEHIAHAYMSHTHGHAWWGIETSLSWWFVDPVLKV